MTSVPFLVPELCSSYLEVLPGIGSILSAQESSTELLFNKTTTITLPYKEITTQIPAGTTTRAAMSTSISQTTAQVTLPKPIPTSQFTVSKSVPTSPFTVSQTLQTVTNKPKLKSHDSFPGQMVHMELKFEEITDYNSLVGLKGRDNNKSSKPEGTIMTATGQTTVNNGKSPKFPGIISLPSVKKMKKVHQTKNNKGIFLIRASKTHSRNNLSSVPISHTSSYTVSYPQDITAQPAEFSASVKVENAFRRSNLTSEDNSNTAGTTNSLRSENHRNSQVKGGSDMAFNAKNFFSHTGLLPLPKYTKRKRSRKHKNRDDNEYVEINTSISSNMGSSGLGFITEKSIESGTHTPITISPSVSNCTFFFFVFQILNEVIHLLGGAVTVSQIKLHL